MRGRTQRSSSSISALGTLIEQGRGSADFSVPAIMLAISLAASSISASSTRSSGCISMAAVAVSARPRASRTSIRPLHVPLNEQLAATCLAPMQRTAGTDAVVPSIGANCIASICSQNCALAFSMLSSVTDWCMTSFSGFRWIFARRLGMRGSNSKGSCRFRAATLALPHSSDVNGSSLMHSGFHFQAPRLAYPRAAPRIPLPAGTLAI